LARIALLRFVSCVAIPQCGVYGLFFTPACNIRLLKLDSQVENSLKPYLSNIKINGFEINLYDMQVIA